MNGPGVGERAGWLVGAALIAVVSSSLGVDRQAPAAGPAAAHAETLVPAAAVEAATMGSSTQATTPVAAVRDPDLAPAASVASAATGPATALAADAFAWPRVAATVVPTTTAVWWTRYHGTNHVWMPTLGIDKPVYLFPCSRSRDPDNYVYRWGCAGTNNVYLLGHAYGVFKALHDSYHNGKLKVGMPVVYADGAGHVHLYRVTTWRVTSPNDVVWAYSAQRVPSMTLQTCIGKDSQYRLDVRLLAVDR